jgi:hypothetical protein
MEVKKSWTLILMQLSEQYLESVSVFKEASRNFMLLFISEKTTKKCRNHCACTESTNLIKEAFKTKIHLMTHSISAKSLS